MTQEKRVALVTGASRGIGRAIAHELGRQGRIVIGTATSKSGAEKIDADLKANGVEGAGMCLNVTDQASIDEVLKTIGERFGAPTILVNNAGITLLDSIRPFCVSPPFRGFIRTSIISNADLGLLNPRSLSLSVTFSSSIWPSVRKSASSQNSFPTLSIC